MLDMLGWSRHTLWEEPANNPHLELLQGDLLLADILKHQVAGGLDAARVILHVQGDGAPGLGAPSHMVELKPHEGLHQSCKQ